MTARTGLSSQATAGPAAGRPREHVRRSTEMINLHDIRYARLGTQDLESAIRFATEIVGLQLVAREGKTAYFRSDKVDVRGDTRDYTLAYVEGDPADHTIGFDLVDADDLDKVGAALEAAGRPVRLGTKDEA